MNFIKKRFGLLIIAYYLYKNHPKFNWRQFFCKLFLYFHYFRKQYRISYVKTVLNTKPKDWSKFGPIITEIPEHGWSLPQLENFVDNLAMQTNERLYKHYSGTIYIPPHEIKKFNLHEFQEKETLANKLSSIFTYSFYKSYLWNSLHTNEFGVGNYLEHCVVKMVASLFGNNLDVMGQVTSGGTESIMLAMKSYRDWGKRNKTSNPVIVAPDTVHAAIMKAGIAYNIEVVLVKTDKFGKVDLEEFDQVCQENSNNLIAIVGSYPSYSNGTVDPLEPFSILAEKYDCGFHVDACLGGFVVNFLDIDAPLDIPNVTSLSVDTHKNGLAPKGSSVLITKNIKDYILKTVNLSYFSIYTVPDWSGGVYGTPGDKGSKSCMPALHAMLAMLAVGKAGYREMAFKINRYAEEIYEVLSLEDTIELNTETVYNVVAFSLDSKYEKGAIYALAHIMEKNGWVLNVLANEMLHICVTGRIISFKNNFNECLNRSLIELEDMNRMVKEGLIEFPGEAGVYGSLGEALTPKKDEMSLTKFFENWVFGLMGANDAVRVYFMRLMNPKY